jgi:predicted DCC family thiol-disulfide oxidoreductase YuxK
MNSPTADAPPAMPAITVYYDGACPLCSREIDGYRRMQGAEQLCWIDIHRACPADLGPDLSPQQALARFHVRTADGTLVSGGGAFIRLWAALPAMRWAAAIAGRPPLSWILEPAYRASLRLRPWLARRRRPGAARV